MKKMNNLLGTILVCGACLFGCQSNSIDDVKTSQEYSYDVEEVVKEWQVLMSKNIGDDTFPVDITCEVLENIVVYTLDSPKSVEFAHNTFVGVSDEYEDWNLAVENLMSWTVGIEHDLYTKHLDYGVGIILGDVEQDEIALTILSDVVIYDYVNGIGVE